MDARLKAQIEELIGLRPGAQARRAVRWADLKNGIAGGAGFNAEAVRNIAEKVAREVAESYDSANIDFAQLQAEINAAMAEAQAARAEVLNAVSAANDAQAYADTIVAQARSDFQIDFNTAISATQDALAASQAAQLAAGGANEDRLAAEAAAQAALAQADQATNERIASQTARSGAESARDAAVVARNTATEQAAAASSSATLATTARNDAQGAAAASASSATLAGSRASDAEASAVASETARQQAQTARGGAEAARDTAVTARQTAETAAATATTQAGLAATAQTNAGNSASAAASSATAAAASATQAGQEASAAESSRLSAEAGRIAAEAARAGGPVLADSFTTGLDQFTTRRGGSPVDPPQHADLTHQPTDATFGTAALWTASSAGANVLTRGTLAPTGRVLRLFLDFEVVSITGATTVSLSQVICFLNASFSDVSIFPNVQMYGVGRHTFAITIAGASGSGVTHVLSQMNNATYLAARAGLRLNENRACSIRIGRLRFEDVTLASQSGDAAASASLARDAAIVARDDAEGARAAAQTSQQLATQSRNEAAGFANAAGTARTQAQNSATAAANSATTAGTHATNAGSSATAANSARLAAEAARDGANSASASAGIARDQAVLARQNAEGAAAAAQESLNLTAEVSGRDMSVINDTFLISSDWGRIGGQGTLTRPANTVYPIGRDWRFVVTNSQNDGLRINQSPATIWPGQTNADAYVVEVEFTLVSGGLGGAGIQLSWMNSAGNNFWTWAALADIQAGVGVSGRTRTARVVLRRPNGYSGTFASHTLTVHANAQEQNWTRQAKTITFHRIRIRPATAEELGSGEVAAGVQANLLVNYLTSAQTNQAVAALEESMTAQMGGDLAAVRRSAAAIANLSGTVARFRQIASVNGEQVAAGIEAVAFNHNGGASGSLLKLIGDNVVAEGTLSANALVVGLGKNLIADAEFTEGSQHWTPGEWDAANHSMLVLPPGSFGAHPAYPTLAARQTGSSTAHASLGFRGVSNDAGGRGWGIPVVPGQRYCASAHLRVTGGGIAEARMQIIWRDASGAVLSNNTPPYAATGGDGFRPDEWPRMAAFGIAPAGAVFAELRAQKRPGTVFPNTLCIWKPQFEEVHASASQPSPWSPGGTTYISGDRLITGGVVSRHVTTETIRAINGRFSSLSAANVSIGNAEVGTLNLAGNAVTVAASQTLTNAITGTSGFQNANQINFTLSQAGAVTIVWFANQGYNFLGRQGYGFRLRINGSVSWVYNENSEPRIETDWLSMAWKRTLGAGTHNIQIDWLGGGNSVTLFSRTLIIDGSMR